MPHDDALNRQVDILVRFCVCAQASIKICNHVQMPLSQRGLLRSAALPVRSSPRPPPTPPVLSLHFAFFLRRLSPADTPYTVLNTLSFDSPASVTGGLLASLLLYAQYPEQCLTFSRYFE